MKVMLFDNAYNGFSPPSSPCRLCILKVKHSDCRKIPTWLCIKCGGFYPSDTKIFTL